MKFNFDLEDIKYIKIVCSDNKGNPCSIKGAIKSITEREVMACAKYEDKLDIKTPQNITLSIVCVEGLYRTKTNLKSVYDEPPYMIFAMETPQGMEYEQNREYFRIPAKYECAYYLNDGEKTSCLTSQTSDISANGVSIVLPMHAISEEDCELEMMINERLIRTKVKYVRSEKLENGYKISFTYTKISNHDRDYISQICIKKQLEQKRNIVL